MNPTLKLTAGIVGITVFALVITAAAGYFYLVGFAQPRAAPEIVLQLGHSDPVAAVAFSPDGKTLASGSQDNTIKLWEAATGQLIRTLSGHTDPVTSVAFSPDGKTLASGSADQHTMKLWEAATGQFIRTFSGHSRWITSVAFSPGRKTLASGSLDQTIKLWEAGTGQLIRTLSGHTDPVTSVAFSPDGKTLASGGRDATTRWWDPAVQSPVLVATAAAGGQFLIYQPATLRYKTSRRPGEQEPAGVRFKDQARPIYPLNYFREELMLPEGHSLTDKGLARPTIAPKLLRLAWDTFQNNAAWITGTVVGYAALVTTLLLAFRHVDPLAVAKQYFSNALVTEVKHLGPSLLRVGGEVPVPVGKRTSDYPALLTQIGASQFALVLDVGKIYVVYKDQPPTIHHLGLLRSQTSDQLIPISARAMERALATKTATADDLRRLEEPFVMRTDPYDEQRPVEADVLFFGRTHAQETIPPALLQGQHVGVFGLRKVGKTSLLNRLRDRLSANPCAWIDCQGYAPVAIDLFNVILLKLSDELWRLGVKNIPEHEAARDANMFREQFLALHRAWSKRAAASRMIVVFDELDKYFPERKDSAHETALREYVALFRMLRALAQEQKCLSVLAVAYRPDINRQNFLSDSVGENPMYMSFQEYFLGFLDERDTIGMIREIGRWRSIDWENNALRLVFELSGGHPLLARFIASDACGQGSKRKVTAHDVENTGAVIRTAFYRHRVGGYIHESVWRFLRSDEQNVLRMAALRNPSVKGERIDPGLQDGLANLLHFGLLIDHDGERQVQGVLLQQWLERNEAQYGT
jgi:hypothetical protein